MADNNHDPEIKKLSLREHKKYVDGRQEAKTEINYIKVNITLVRARQKCIKAVSETLKVLLPIREG